MKRKKTSAILFILIIICTIYTLTNPFQTAFHARNAIKLCAFSLIPSLFVFMVFSRMLSHICESVSSSGSFLKAISRFFSIPPVLLPICLSGLFCGAPSGAFAISRLYREGFCTKNQAEKACIISNNCSAAFILGFVSAILESKSAVIYILISNISANIIVYLIFFRDEETKEESKTKESYPHKKFSEIITDSISSSVTATATLCGYVIFFYTFTQIICDRLSSVIYKLPLLGSNSSLVTSAICSFFEITSGVLQMGFPDREKAIVLCSAAIAFTSLSMIFQVLDIMTKAGLSVKNYIFSKILCCFVSPIITVILLLLSPASVFVYSQNAQKITRGISQSDIFFLVFATAISFTGAFILSQLDKKHKK